MVIDAALKLVIERAREADGATFYVYAQAISRNTAKEFWRVIQAAVGKLYFGGGNPTIAPRFAAEAIREAAKEMGLSERVEQHLIGEIKRLAIVVAPGAAGWENMPFEEALKRGVLSEDEADELESAIAFFTLAWRFHSTNERTGLISSAVTLWRARTTSSSFTEFLASFPTLKETGSSGETTAAAPVRDAAGLSVPS
jgi:hypothetical protein